MVRLTTSCSTRRCGWIAGTAGTHRGASRRALLWTHPSRSRHRPHHDRGAGAPARRRHILRAPPTHGSTRHLDAPTLGDTSTRRGRSDSATRGESTGTGHHPDPPEQPPAKETHEHLDQGSRHLRQRHRRRAPAHRGGARRRTGERSGDASAHGAGARTGGHVQRERGVEGAPRGHQRRVHRRGGRSDLGRRGDLRCPDPLRQRPLAVPAVPGSHRPGLGRGQAGGQGVHRLHLQPDPPRRPGVHPAVVLHDAVPLGRHRGAARVHRRDPVPLGQPLRRLARDRRRRLPG